MSDRLLAWSTIRSAPVWLASTGLGGGQSSIYQFESDPNTLAAVPIPGEDVAAYFGKGAALPLALGTPRDFAVPTETLVAPQDKTSPVALAMPRLPGRTLEELFFPAEREALGLPFGPTERRELALPHSPPPVPLNRSSSAAKSTLKLVSVP